MPPIAGLTDKPRMPRQGKIRLGIKKMSASGKEYPSAVDYFVCNCGPGAEFGGEWLMRVYADATQGAEHVALIKGDLTGDAPESVVSAAEAPQVAGRSMLVQRLKPIPVEAVVRGYLAGSGWKEYQRRRTVCKA